MKGVKKGERRWRIRIGNFRVVYAIYDQEHIVEILDIEDRKDVYK